MASNQQTPKKGDIFINPKTNRPIKVGGLTWLKLVKEGIIDGGYKDSHELKEISEGLTPEQLVEEKEKLNAQLPPNKQAVLGRGKHKGKYVVRDKGLNPVDVSRYTAKAASQAVKKNIGKLANASNDQDISNMLEKMILEEMMSQNRAPRPKLTRQTGYYKIHKKQGEEDEYEALESSEDEEEDEYEYEYED